MGVIITLLLLWIALVIAGIIRLSKHVTATLLVILTSACFLLNFIGLVTYITLISLEGLTLAILSYKGLRQKILTKFLYNSTKKKIKAISATEKTALNAGDSWLEADIFQGKVDFNKLLTTKNSELSDEEQHFLNNETEELCNMLDDWKIMHIDKNLDTKTWDFIKKKGFLGLVIAPEYGGKGFSAAAHSAIVKKIATKSMTAAITVMVPNSLGPGELITNYGTDKQKKEILPKLAAAKEIPCFGLTGTYAGSDATSMADTGIVCEQNKVLGIRLNFSKRYITLAPIATLIGLAFKLEDPDGLLKGKGEPGITLCLISSKVPGLISGNRHLPLGIPFMNGPISGKDIFIPIESIIGGQEMAGKGWHMLVECLSIGRSISLPAICDAYNCKALIETSAYAVIREQFNSSIINFEGVASKIAVMAGYTYMCKATRIFTLTAVDNGIKPGVASAIAKYHLTEVSRKVISNAMDIHGGKAIMSGKENYLATAYQGLPICITVEGANILTRNLIIFGQGAVRSHPYIFSELEALAADDKLEDFDSALLGHINYIFDNWCQQGFQTITAGYFAPHPKSKLSQHYKQLHRLSLSFAAVSDYALVSLGSKLKSKERLSARLGDIMSNLYMALATLKYFHDRGEPDNELDIVNWVVINCLYESQEAMLNFLNNYPNKAMGKIIRLKVFPWGRPYNKPSDKLEHKIAKQISYDNDLRNSFCEGINISDASVTIISAYNLVTENNNLYKRIKNAISNNKIQKYANGMKQIEVAYIEKIINDEEYKSLCVSEKMRIDALAVDIFSSDLKSIVDKC
jgi:acyl-CoA dehydrogenase